MVVDSGSQSAKDDNDLVKDQDSLIDSTGGPSNNRRRARTTKKDRKKKERTSQNYRLKPPPKIMANNKQQDVSQLNNDGGSGVQIEDSRNYSAVELGQDNLKQQLDFIQEVSNPLVKDQDPIDPEAPVEIEFSRIAQIRKSERIRKKQSNKQVINKVTFQSTHDQDEKDEEDVDETSDEDMEDNQMDALEKFEEQKEHEM